MTLRASITCDGCGFEPKGTDALTLNLVVMPRPPVKGPVTTYYVHVVPPIDEPKHFCGLDCLRTWLRDPK